MSAALHHNTVLSELGSDSEKSLQLVSSSRSSPALRWPEPSFLRCCRATSGPARLPGRSHHDPQLNNSAFFAGEPELDIIFTRDQEGATNKLGCWSRSYGRSGRCNLSRKLGAGEAKKTILLHPVQSREVGPGLGRTDPPPPAKTVLRVEDEGPALGI